MLEPSKPMPSEKSDLVISPTGMLKCCQVPRRSTKRRSTILMPSSFALRMTSDGLVLDVVVGDIVADPSSTRTASDLSIAIGTPSADGWLLRRHHRLDPRSPRHSYLTQTRVLAGSGLWTPQTDGFRGMACAQRTNQRGPGFAQFAGGWLDLRDLGSGERLVLEVDLVDVDEQRPAPRARPPRRRWRRPGTGPRRRRSRCTRRGR